MTASTRLTNVTLADQAFEVLLERVAGGTYPPGYLLRELDLVAQLGVSRTPIREALLRLAEYGLVCGTGRSVRVRQITPDEVSHIFQVRTALELAAIDLACGRLTAADFTELDALTPAIDARLDEPASARLDRRLHLLIAERSGNPILLHEIRRLLDLVRLAHRHLGGSRAWLQREVAEHTAVIEALRAGDRRRSHRALKAHLQSARRTNARIAGRPDP